MRGLTSAERTSLEKASRGDFSAFDRVVVAYSGGKDSTACVLLLLALGCPHEKLELWHHDVDGEGRPFMDWPVTRDYCAAVAAHLRLRLYYSWKVGGFRGELLRTAAPTLPTRFETPGGLFEVGGAGPVGTRRKFPAVSADLSVRWCSSYLKIQVGEKVFANDPRFAAGRFLFVTGERREESAARARRPEAEVHKTSTRSRSVIHWRPLLDWPEAEVWKAFAHYGIVPHPAYRLGWGRLSCISCIFGNADQWASVRIVAPEQFAAIAELERRLGHTIRHGVTVGQLADRGVPYVSPADRRLIAISRSSTYTDKVTTTGWKPPRGAYRKDGGPS